MIVCGMDLGSTTAKCIIIEKEKIILKKIVRSSEWREILPPENIPICATGYFRRQVNAELKVTEITADMVGVKHLLNDVEVIVDIGGQDTKIMNIRNNDIILNDRCSAGTGAFLDFIASYLNVKVHELQKYHEKHSEKCPINSTCTVFALSEVISHLVNGKKKENVIAGVHSALANRICELIPESEKIAIIGGVAKNGGLIKEIEEILGKKVLVPPEPQLCTAIGAGIIMMKEAEKIVDKNIYYG